MTRRSAAFAVMAALLAAPAAAPASGLPTDGWVRSRTDKGTPIFWPGSCAWLVPDTAASPDLPLATVVQIIDQSVANWQTPSHAANCSGAAENPDYLQIMVDPPAAGEAKLDHVNVVKFRSDKWCRPADGATAEMCYSSAATAITTIFYDSQPGQPNDGNIVDADIELNDIDFTFVWIDHVTPTVKPNTLKADLENTLTHEIGHFQGLDHTCWDHVSATQPVDNTGQKIPDCADVIAHRIDPDQEQRIVQATMYNYASPTETIKRMPKLNDLAGVCTIYPQPIDPKSCTRPGPPSKGCAVATGMAPARPTWLSGIGLIAISLLALRRRSRRP